MDMDEKLANARRVHKGSVLQFRMQNTPYTIEGNNRNVRIARWLVEWDALDTGALKLCDPDRNKLVLMVLKEGPDRNLIDPLHVTLTTGTPFKHLRDYFEREVLPHLEFLEVTN